MDTPRRTQPFIHAAYLVLLALVALLPRLLDLGLFITHDEAEFWIERSRQFWQAMQAGDYGATAISTHPGVTTMWSGMLGMMLREWLFTQGILQTDSLVLLLTWQRVPAVLVHTAGILLGYYLLRRILPASVAMLAALLWAADPLL
ncbi:MAG: hypothetical protein HC876_15645 [Chloroflexaceae bacterium]|nr:hypothetical protein [Chloroflexaceae bacterium]